MSQTNEAVGDSATTDTTVGSERPLYRRSTKSFKGFPVHRGAGQLQQATVDDQFQRPYLLDHFGQIGLIYAAWSRKLASLLQDLVTGERSTNPWGKEDASERPFQEYQLP